jgi:D-alanyl-D-alanine carboxypeptidase/D-alanyl-D-alanine-endopeptidase (penicillin-binding protein 4)
MNRKYLQVHRCVLVMVAYAMLSLSTGARASEEISGLKYSFLNAESLLNSSLPGNATWSLTVASLETGELYSSGNAGQAFLPTASLAKLFVTAAVLERNSLSPIRLDTEIRSEADVIDGVLQGSMYLIGHGNALLSEKDFEEAVRVIARTGIRTIAGDIVADDTYFDVEGFSTERSGPAYAVPGALGLDLHTVSVIAGSNGLGAEVSPKNDYVTLVSRQGTGEIRRLDDLHYEVPLNSDKKRFSVDEPALFAVHSFRTALESHGITVTGAAVKGRMPEVTTLLYSIPSRPIREIIHETNTYSLNVMAENLLLVLGAKAYGSPGTYAKGIKAVGEFLTRLGLSADSVVLLDGSGISGTDRTDSMNIVNFLKRISDKPWFDEFYASLPRAGMDGTLSGLQFKDTGVRAKTGQTERAFGLAGYFENSYDFGATFLATLTGTEK